MSYKWNHRTVAALVFAVLVVAASGASAEMGDGVKGGPFILHPGISLSAGFDSNLFYSSLRDDERVYNSPEALIEPRLSVETDDANSWDLSGLASVSWRQYLSDEERIREQSGLAADLSADATWNADGAFSLQFSEQFTRTNETPNHPSARTINRIFNQAGVMAGLHPGGRILETFLSYDFALHRHSDQVAGLDRNAHHFGWHGHWSFLPKTALVAEVDHRRIRYRQDFRGGPGVSPDGQLRNSDSNPIRLLGGIEGMVTQRISVGARAGYGWGRYVTGPSPQGGVFRVNSSYQFGTVAHDNRIRVGYERDFEDSPIGNYYTSDRFLAGYEQGLFENRLRLTLEADAQIRRYSEVEIDAAETEAGEITYPDTLSDFLVGLTASANYELRQGWTAGLRYRMRSNFTDDAIEVDQPDLPAEQAIRDYQRHHLLLSTEITY